MMLTMLYPRAWLTKVRCLVGRPEWATEQVPIRGPHPGGSVLTRVVMSFFF